MIKLDRKILIKLHSGFWALVVALIGVSFLSGSLDDSQTNIFWGYFFRIFFRLIYFYIFYYAANKSIFEKPRLALSVIAGVIFISLSTLLLNYLFLSALSALNHSIYSYLYYRFMYFELLASHFVFSAIGILFSLSAKWYRRTRNQSELERQSMSNKLALLAAQINPHFLFNTLNNINSFIQMNSPKAPFAINKLKRIMKYMLNVSSMEMIFLDKDIENIRDYIELQRIRYASHDYIQFNVSGSSAGVLLPPLLFMPLVENAFKHGKKQSRAPGIVFDFFVNKDSVNFSSFNYVSGNNELQEKGGFGLANIKSRLDLLFEDKYYLEINRNDETFTVKMKINYNC